MKKTIVFMSIGLAGLTLMATGSQGQQTRAEPLPAQVYDHPRRSGRLCDPAHAESRWVDGGIIDVQTPSPSSLTVAMTGTPAADSYLGCTSTATQTFQLIQDFEIACSDPSITRVCLTLDSTLAGYVRSVRKAGPLRPPGQCVGEPGFLDRSAAGTGPSAALRRRGRRSRSATRTSAVQGPPMPLGRYTLVANFVLDTTASGVCNAHAAADFSPDTACPPTG